MRLIKSIGRRGLSSLRRDSRSRRGAIIVLAAIFMIAMLGMVAFSVDVGYIAKVQSELKRAADAGALAGAAKLANGTSLADTEARNFVSMNRIGGRQISTTAVKVEVGKWDSTSRSFTVTDQSPGAIRVSINNTSEPLFFGRVLNRGTVDLNVSAVAMHQPRDIMLALDFSGSMCDDSRLGAIDTLGRNFIESNLFKMYQELGSPNYGNMTFTPQYATVVGRTPTNSNHAQITLKFQNTSVNVTSTKSITSVRLQFANGNTQTVSASGTSGTYSGTGSNASSAVEKAWIKSGTYDSGQGYGEQFADDATTLKKSFNLTNVAYPYPGGSWDAYLSYVKTDSEINGAGYRKKYGYLTWINYLQSQEQSNSDTPDLWKTSEQPVTALKDACDVFFSYLQTAHQDDRVGVSLYTSSNETAVLESQLTQNYSSLATTIRKRQAGHYTAYTNIYDGMKTARIELQNNARPNAYKMLVLMTDGQANRPGSTSNARSMVLQEASSAAAAKIPVVCIGLGAGADNALLQQVADITGGAAFIIPGGQSVAAMQEQLEDVFRQVADKAPLKLVE